jgi:hypothetical protein
MQPFKHLPSRFLVEEVHAFYSQSPIETIPDPVQGRMGGNVSGYSRSKWLVSEDDVFDERRLEGRIMHGMANSFKTGTTRRLFANGLFSQGLRIERNQLPMLNLEAIQVTEQLLYSVKPSRRHKSKSTQRIFIFVPQDHLANSN